MYVPVVKVISLFEISLFPLKPIFSWSRNIVAAVDFYYRINFIKAYWSRMFFEEYQGFSFSPALPATERLFYTSLFPVHVSLLSSLILPADLVSLPFALLWKLRKCCIVQGFWESEFNYRMCHSSSTVQFMGLNWVILKGGWMTKCELLLN